MQGVIAICGARLHIDSVEYDAVRSRYVDAVVRGMGAVPVLVPLAVNRKEPIRELLEILNGLLLVGDQSNIAAARYGAEQLPSAAKLDPARDEAGLSLIPAAIQAGVPVLGICRGLQELNVAYGGDLHQDLTTLNSPVEHREDEAQPRDMQYLASHEISVLGPLLTGILRKRRVAVNSLHNQGIRTLARGLVCEAVAPDNLIEAASVADASAFCLGVQWHPEWYFDRDEVSVALFQAFARACRKRNAERGQQNFRVHQRYEVHSPFVV